MANPVRMFPALAAAAVSALFWLAPHASADSDDSAVFEVQVDVSWSAETHPLEFPAAAHLTSILAVTHHARYIMFADGNTASGGLELVAENGRTPILKAELAEAARRGRVDAITESDALKTVPGQLKLTITAKKSHALLSFVTMIAPSPDWFTGAAAIPLLDGDEWIEQSDVVLWAWDSGTDGGNTYVTEDMDTQPRQSVRLVAAPHFLQPSGLVAMGRATVRRVRN